MHPFVKLMKQIESSGTFSAFGKMGPIFPGLMIQNVGEISLPLSEHQAKDIVNQCEQALKRFEFVEQARRTIEEIFSFINSPRIL